MDLPWGEERNKQFVTNVGLITSNGPNGHDIMSAEWTHHVSYSPGLIAVCVNFHDATHENIKATKRMFDDHKVKFDDPNKAMFIAGLLEKTRSQPDDFFAVLDFSGILT